MHEYLSSSKLLFAIFSKILSFGSFPFCVCAMAISRRALLVTAATALSTGIGGFLLGCSYDNRERFAVHAQLKDVFQPSQSDDEAVSSQDTPPTRLHAKSIFSFKEPNVSPSAESSAGISVGPHRASEIMRFGFPTMDTIRSRSDYVLSYDRKNRTALWVAEHLTAERLNDRTKVSRKLSDFREDPSIHPYFRASNADYLRSGFDRGHLAAAGNHWISQESVDETFYLSNMSPQVGVGFNRDAWNKLEQYTRSKTKTNANVFVMTGPLYLPTREPNGSMYIKYQVIGDNNVAVPTHFFKALLCQAHSGEFHMECFVMPNIAIDNSVPLQAFQVPRDTIERSAGFLLFDGLPKNLLKTVNGRKV